MSGVLPRVVPSSGREVRAAQELRECPPAKVKILVLVRLLIHRCQPAVRVANHQDYSSQWRLEYASACVIGVAMRPTAVISL